jgi:hypothetical protein
MRKGNLLEHPLEQVVQDYREAWFRTDEPRLRRLSFSVAEAARELHTSQDAVRRMIDRRELAGWHASNGELLVLKHQLRNHRVVPGLAEVLKIIGKEGEGTVALWLTEPDPGFKDKSPLVALQKGQRKLVQDYARQQFAKG